MGTLTYTQHTVAFPRLRLDGTTRDELLISDGEGSEFNISFHSFTPRHQGVQVEVFGDGLRTFYDERVQRVVAEWREQEVPDDASPKDFIGWLEAVGVVPSEYHAGVKGASR